MQFFLMLTFGVQGVQSDYVVSITKRSALTMSPEKKNAINTATLTETNNVSLAHFMALFREITP